jgi:hypothetical protein
MIFNPEGVAASLLGVLSSKVVNPKRNVSYAWATATTGLMNCAGWSPTIKPLRRSPFFGDVIPLGFYKSPKSAFLMQVVVCR